MTTPKFRSLVLAGFLVAMGASASQADLDVGLKIDDDGIKSFYIAVGEQYRVPTKEVIAIRQNSIPDEELPVVFFIARQAGVLPEFVLRYRLDGKSWMDIVARYGMTAEIFYVAVKGDFGPPYGRALGHFKGKKRTEWRSIRLADPDIVNLVNLRFMMDQYGYTPERVIQARHQGKSFVTINRDFHVEKSKGKKKDKPALASKGQASEESGTKGNGKSKNKGK